MTNQEELKTMIKCFRVHDLRALLSFAGRSRSGKKRVLQDRALNLLQIKSQPLRVKIRQLYDSMQRGYSSNILNVEVNKSSLALDDRDDGGGPFDEEDDNILIGDEIDRRRKESFSLKEQSCAGLETKNICSYSFQTDTTLQLPVNSLYYPIHPDVKFKKLPFYKVLYELLRPSTLVPQNYHVQQKNLFVFYLTPQQAAAICLSRNARPGAQQDFTVQGQLRFCLSETTSVQEDSFPSNLIVKVNNKYCTVQEPPPRKKKDIYVKECAPPIDITPLMKINPSEGNKVEVHWNTEYGRAYAIGIFLVQKKTSEDLLNRLKAKGVRCSDYTRGMIKDKLNEEADGEIVTTSLRVSLICPLGKMKLKTPCRASTCEHLQCFDASLFLQMNEKKPTWCCPVCDSPAEYDKLIIDGYFQEILSSDKFLPQMNEVELHSDGSWSSLAVKTEENGSGDGKVSSLKTVKVEVEVEEVIELVEEESKCSSSSKTESEVVDIRLHEPDQPTVSSSAIESRIVDEIDLTVSDSDDEPLIWYKRRESSKSRRKGVVLSDSSSNSSTPSVVNLDSDSSDSIPLVISSQFPILSHLL